MGYENGKSSKYEKVTKEMMDAFNNRPDKPEQWTTGTIKSQYLTSINKTQNHHDKFYDSGLVEEISGYATVYDLNINNVLLSRSLKYWGIFVICVLFFYLLTQIARIDNSIIQFITLILSFITYPFMFTVLLLNIKGFIKTIGSSRDVKYKLLSMIQVLPIILIILCLIELYYISAPLLLSVLIIIAGGLGYAILLCLDYGDIQDLVK